MIALGYQIAAGLVLTGIAAAGGYMKGAEHTGNAKDLEIAAIEAARSQAVSQWKAEQAESARLRAVAWDNVLLHQFERQAAELALEKAQGKEVVIYEQTDPNALNCGLSCNGVRIWNTRAIGVGGMSEAPAPAACQSGSQEEGTIAANNAQVVAAADQSFADHHECLAYVDDLYAWVETFCQAPPEVNHEESE
jgi:hypothetical protein